MLSPVKCFSALAIFVIACGGAAPPTKTRPRAEKTESDDITAKATGPRRLVVSLDKYTPPVTDKKRAPQATFKKVSSQKNQITDDAEWFDRNGFELPNRPRSGIGVPDEVDGAPLRATFDGSPVVHLFEDKIKAFLGVEGPEGGGIVTLYDVSALRRVTPHSPNDAEDTVVNIFYARVQGDILYVCHAHDSYAKASDGQNAFVTAILTADGMPTWRSPPLVCNARNFVLTGPLLVTGYGYTSEPDFLYALHADTGLMVGKTRLDSGPEYIFERDGELYVRSYDHDYRFTVDVK